MAGLASGTSGVCFVVTPLLACLAGLRVTRVCLATVARAARCGDSTRPCSAIQFTISIASSRPSSCFRAFISMCAVTTESVYTTGASSVPEDARRTASRSRHLRCQCPPVSGVRSQSTSDAQKGTVRPLSVRLTPGGRVGKERSHTLAYVLKKESAECDD